VTLRLVILSLLLGSAVPLIERPQVLAVQPIDDAFGMRLGATFDPSDVPDVIIGGAPAYYFTPSDPSPLFDFYFVQITPVTNRIHTIGAVGKTDDLKTCRTQRAGLMARLTNKHGPVTEFGLQPAATFDLDYELIVQGNGARVIGVSCGGTAPIIFSLTYYADDLADLAEEERLDFAREAKLRR
jgi:hypothetical protein